MPDRPVEDAATTEAAETTVAVPEGGGGSTLSLNVQWRNASPQEMENAILRPLEEELRTIPGIKTVTSRTRESSANVSIEFGQRQDMDLAVAEVRDRIERENRESAHRDASTLHARREADAAARRVAPPWGSAAAPGPGGPGPAGAPPQG